MELYKYAASARQTVTLSTHLSSSGVCPTFGALPGGRCRSRRSPDSADKNIISQVRKLREENKVSASENVEHSVKRKETQCSSCSIHHNGTWPKWGTIPVSARFVWLAFTIQVSARFVWLAFKSRNRNQSLRYCRPLRGFAPEPGLTGWPLQIPLISSFLRRAPITNWKYELKSCCVTPGGKTARSGQTAASFRSFCSKWVVLARSTNRSNTSPPWPPQGLQHCFYPIHHRKELHFTFFSTRYFANIFPARVGTRAWFFPSLWPGPAVPRERVRFTVAVEELEVRSLQSATYQCWMQQRHILGSLSKKTRMIYLVNYLEKKRK